MVQGWGELLEEQDGALSRCGRILSRNCTDFCKRFVDTFQLNAARRKRVRKAQGCIRAISPSTEAAAVNRGQVGSPRSPLRLPAVV